MMQVIDLLRAAKFGFEKGPVRLAPGRRVGVKEIRQPVELETDLRIFFPHQCKGTRQAVLADETPGANRVGQRCPVP